MVGIHMRYPCFTLWVAVDAIDFIVANIIAKCSNDCLDSASQCDTESRRVENGVGAPLMSGLHKK
jgi:hypothetical protein